MGGYNMTDTTVTVADTERAFGKLREFGPESNGKAVSPYSLPSSTSPYTMPPAPSKSQAIARLLTELTYGEMMELGNAVSALTQDKLNPVDVSNVLHGWATSIKKD
jgi:hypothetical protein